MKRFILISSLSETLNRLLNHDGFKRYGANTAWLLTERIIRIFFGLFVGIWLARYLGPEKFGSFSYAKSFVLIFLVIASLGLDNIVVKELVEHKERRDTVLGTAFFLRFIFIIIGLPVFLLLVYLISDDISTNFLIFILSLSTIFQSLQVIDLYYQSEVQSKFVSSANIISICVASATRVMLILLSAPLVSFAVVAVVETLLSIAGLIWFYTRIGKLSIFFWKFDKKMAICFIRDSFPILATLLMVNLYNRVDQIMLGEMLSKEAVGQYAVAVSLSEIWLFIPVAICGSFFPAIVRAKQSNDNTYIDKLIALYSMIFWLGFGFALFITLVSNYLINMLYGNTYKQAAPLMAINAWATVLAGVGSAVSSWIINERLMFNAFLRGFIAVLMNILLNLHLIPLYGAFGAAISTLISYIFVNYLSLFMFSSTRPCFYYITKSFNIFNMRKIFYTG